MSNPLEIFITQFEKDKLPFILSPVHANIIELIKEALTRKLEIKTVGTDTRYLLLLAQNENALDLLNNYILNIVMNKSTLKIQKSSSARVFQTIKTTLKFAVKYIRLN